MHRTLSLSLLSVIVLSLSLLGVAARAQEASPGAEEEGIELPPGVGLAILAQVAPYDLPDEPVALVAVRLTMEAGATIPPHPHPGGEFGVVEAGSVTVGTVEGPAVLVSRAGAAAGATPEAAGPGQELTANAGDAVIVPSGNVSDTRAGDEGATILIFEFAAAGA